MKAEPGTERWIPGTPAERLLLFLLLLLALVLRAWDLPQRAFLHDELSALVRLYPTLGDTLRNGVIGVDTHPPGVQVFLWAWTAIGGLGEAWVKAPFIVASVLALVLYHRIAVHLCGTSVALVLIAVLATIQYTVLYGQLARPYAFGFLTTAWMADRLLRYRDAGGRWPLAAFVAAAVLSGYTHHIALLQALLIAVTGLWLVAAEQRKSYLLACGAAVVLYLPNVPLLLQQFAWKGLDEWLPTPTLGWFLDHARFITHWSVVFGLLLFGLVAWALVRGVRKKLFTKDMLVVFACWGLMPYLIVYGYSIVRSPVLQHSVMLFAFPYILLFALAGLKGVPFPRIVPVVIACITLSLSTLITVRQHFTLTHRSHSRYEAIATGIAQANATGAVALTDAPEHMIRFYHDRWNTPPELREHVDLTGMDAAQVAEVLDSLQADRVFLGITLQARPGRREQVQQHFPFLLERHDMAEGQTFLLGATPGQHDIDDITFSSSLSPQAVEGTGWAVDKRIPLVTDTVGPVYARMRRWDMSRREYGITFSKPLSELVQEGCAVIEAEADGEGTPGRGSPLLVLDVQRGKELLAYHTSTPTGPLLVVANMVNVPSGDQGTVSAYVWNKDQVPFTVSSVTVRVRHGDPVLYGLLGPIRGTWRYR